MVREYSDGDIDAVMQIDGFIGLNDDYIEGIFVKDAMQSKGIGKQLNFIYGRNLAFNPKM